MAASFAPNSNTSNSQQQSTSASASKEIKATSGLQSSTTEETGSNPAAVKKEIPTISEQEQSCTCSKEIIKKPETLCQKKQQGKNQFIRSKIIFL